MNTRLVDLILSAPSTRITVIGDVILDTYIQGDANRISPEAPIQVLDVREERNVLGGAANVAANLRGFGAEVELCGLLGRDRDSELLREMLLALNVGTGALLEDPHRPTIKKTRVVARNQQIIRIDREVRHPLDPGQEETLFAALGPILDRSDMVVLSDYAKGVLTEGLIRRIMGRARVDVLADPKGKDFSRYRGCRLLTPNRREVEEATGFPLRERGDLRRAVDHLLRMTGAGEMVITLGAEGIYYSKGGEEDQLIPAQTRAVYDVTGAGDTVISLLAFCLASGMVLDDAVRIANAGAGIVVGKPGAAAPSRRELVDFFSLGSARHLDKIMIPARAAERGEEIRRSGERLVFTNGCFDLIHGGHVALLRAAKGLGDHLMVGVNDDESVKRLKGPRRPVLALEERMEILASLQMVDYVVPFSEDTPLEIIRSVTPGILAKGEDWKERGVVGREWVEEHGGEVVLLPLRAGYSTTGVIERILERFGADAP